MADSEEKPASGEEFLSRWSRRKQQVREEQAAPPVAVTPATQDKPPELPPVEGLNIQSDFRGFLHPKVDESLRRAALKKLFHEPHFNVMDGLDTYVDDYSVSDPIPEAMLKQMKHAQDIIVAGNERREEAARLEEAERQRLAAAGGQDSGAMALPDVEPEPVVPAEELAAQPENNDKVTPRA
ncbi:MAG: hypothetical protein RJA24_1805 [Pseudomonadota bacterium]